MVYPRAEEIAVGGGANHLSLSGNADNKRMLELRKIASLTEFLTKGVHPFRCDEAKPCRVSGGNPRAKHQPPVAGRAEMVGCESD